jgi:hypothetical protein
VLAPHLRVFSDLIQAVSVLADQSKGLFLTLALVDGYLARVEKFSSAPVLGFLALNPASSANLPAKLDLKLCAPFS